MRDLHPGHDRMTVDISVRVFAAEFAVKYATYDSTSQARKLDVKFWRYFYTLT